MGSRVVQPRNQLKTLRESRGTQRTVAIELGITETHLREIESGRSIPGTKLLIRIEHYFGKPDNELFPDLHDPAYFSTCDSNLI